MIDHSGGILSSINLSKCGTSEYAKTAYDIIIEETNPEYVNFEFDSYWMTDGGAQSIMEKLGKRLKLRHINDRRCRKSGPYMTPLLKEDAMEPGYGNMNLEKLSEIAIRNRGVSYSKPTKTGMTKILSQVSSSVPSSRRDTSQKEPGNNPAERREDPDLSEKASPGLSSIRRKEIFSKFTYGKTADILERSRLCLKHTLLIFTEQHIPPHETSN